MLPTRALSVAHRPRSRGGSSGEKCLMSKAGAIALSEKARNNYFYARAMVGRELSVPAVEPAYH